MRLITDPTAAGLSYCFDKFGERKTDVNVLVFNMGGGTTDVSLLTLDDGICEVRAMAGNNHLGG